MSRGVPPLEELWGGYTQGRRRVPAAGPAPWTCGAATRQSRHLTEPVCCSTPVAACWPCCTQDENGTSNGCEWLPVAQVGNLMREELGYEDEPEFEDALHGSFSDWLNCLPHVVKKPKNGTVYACP